MTKLIQILFCILIFISCNEEEKSKINSDNLNNQDSLIIDETNQIQFADIIPENISDSSKVEIIKKWTDQIDTDTMLTHKRVMDSIHSQIELFYRNGTLVKIIKGHPPGLMLKTTNFLTHNYTAYYFLMDTLICSKFECSSYQQTGRCNPVAIARCSIVYKRKIIFEITDNKIGQYSGCGCNVVSYFATKPENRFEIDYKEIKRLKEIAKTANTM